MQRATHCDSWYPSGKRLDTLMGTVFGSAKVDETIPGRVKAVISPHAGYSYCAETAAHVYKTIKPDLFERVVILGPSHRLYREDCTIVNAKEMETPYGNVMIDELAEKLVKKPGFNYLDIANAEDEHSLEMMMPFLKYVFKSKNFTVLPIMVGHLNDEVLNTCVETLRPIVMDEKTLLVISSDFVHWGGRFRYTYLPEGDEPIYKRISKIDHQAMELISSCDIGKFRSFLEETKATICGRVPITLAMMIFNCNYRVDWPHYSQSSQVTSKSDTSVSYAGGVFRLL